MIRAILSTPSWLGQAVEVRGLLSPTPQKTSPVILTRILVGPYVQPAHVRRKSFYTRWLARVANLASKI